MELIKTTDYEEMSKIAAEIIIKAVNTSKKLTIGLATGSTPEGLYRHLIQDHKNNYTTYRHVTTFNLDEYVGMKASDKNSYYYYMNERLFNHIDISHSNVHLPKGDSSQLDKECLRYEELIEDSGGIDIQVLGIGENGHIGFNEPGSSFQSSTQVVKLAPSTREANSRFFPDLREVPTHAITMGISTILRSKKILLLVSGEKKEKALKRLLHGDVSEQFPASILKNHPNVSVIVDKKALSEILIKN